MGLFFNYDKPGKGVDKDAPKKKGLFLYFELLWRKLGMLFTSNILYFLVSLPVIVLFYLFSAMLLSSVITVGTEEVGFTQLCFLLTALLTIFYGTGPVSCGYAYLMRSFAREEHVWLASDFFQRTRENFKQGLIILIVDCLLLFAGTNAIVFYASLYKNGHQIGLIMAAVVTVCMMLYTFMHFYLYQFAVTFENKTAALFKNAFIMSVASLPMNIFLAALVCIATYLLFSVLTPIAIILAMLLFWVSFMRFPIDFYSARVIQRRLINTQVSGESEE